jgi:hypothetical protein
MREQSRAEQSRAEQSRAEQSRAEQSRAEQSRAEQINAHCAQHASARVSFFSFWCALALTVAGCGSQEGWDPLEKAGTAEQALTVATEGTATDGGFPIDRLPSPTSQAELQAGPLVAAIDGPYEM